MVEIQARDVSLSWSVPPRTEAGGEGDTAAEGDEDEEEEEEEEEGEAQGEEGADQTPPDPPFTYEVSVSYSGKDGRYKSVYR